MRTMDLLSSLTQIKIGGVRVAVVGQAFPYTPIANPTTLYFPDWTFGIRMSACERIVDRIRESEAPDLRLYSPTMAWTWI